jgi:hypothetical protein
MMPVKLRAPLDVERFTVTAGILTVLAKMNVTEYHTLSRFEVLHVWRADVTERLFETNGFDRV